MAHWVTHPHLKFSKYKTELIVSIPKLLPLQWSDLKERCHFSIHVTKAGIKD